MWCVCVVCRVGGRTVRAVLVLESCALQQVVVVQSPAGVEGELGWRGDPRTGRTSVSQSINPVNKQIASLLNSGRVEGRDRPKAGGMLRAQVLACLCSCSTAQKLMQAVRRTGWQGRAGQLVPWGLGLLLAAGKRSREPGAQLPFLVRQRAKLTVCPNKRQPWSLGRFI